jgi:hypothetical protein
MAPIDTDLYQVAEFVLRRLRHPALAGQRRYWQGVWLGTSYCSSSAHCKGNLTRPLRTACEARQKARKCSVSWRQLVWCAYLT